MISIIGCLFEQRFNLKPADRPNFIYKDGPSPKMGETPEIKLGGLPRKIVADKPIENIDNPAGKLIKKGINSALER